MNKENIKEKTSIETKEDPFDDPLEDMLILDDIYFEEENDDAELVVKKKAPEDFVGSWTATSARAEFQYGMVNITIKADGKALNIPAIPVRSTNANGLTDALHYQVYGPLNNSTKIEVTASQPGVAVTVSPVVDGRATVRCTYQGKEKVTLKLGVHSLPKFSRDTTDRNRTSPFAFTGNRFEFRMVGSRDSISAPCVILNTIVAEAFSEASDALEASDNIEQTVQELIVKYAVEHQRIIFNGDGYADEWVKEAARRGLPNIPSMVEAIPVRTTEKAVKLFETFGVFTREELESRAEIQYENYAKDIRIEGNTMLEMTKRQYIPAVVAYTCELADTVNSVEKAGADASLQRRILNQLSDYLHQTDEALDELEKKMEAYTDYAEGHDQAIYCHEVIVPAMEKLRAPVDKMELLVDRRKWPVPTYGELLFKV